MPTIATNSLESAIYIAIKKARQILDDLHRTPAANLTQELQRKKEEFRGVTAIFEDFAPNVLAYTEATCNLTIEHNIVQYIKTFSATVALYENNGVRRAVLNVREGTDCEIRYYTCKELMHLHLITDENMTSNKEQFSQMLKELTNTGNISQQNASHQSLIDIAAYYGAIEMLMPHGKLETLRHYGVEDPDAIAELFRIPTYIVEQALSPTVRRFYT